MSDKGDLIFQISEEAEVVPEVGEVKVYTIITDHIKLCILNYGAIIKSLEVKDALGQWTDIVLGYDSVRDYVNNPKYFGAVIGRFANRIKHGRLVVNERLYQLGLNSDKHHLHGGFQGFDSRIWQSKLVTNARAIGIEFELVSPDGDQGYPGNLVAKVNYLVNNQGQLSVTYHAESDQKTVCNLTQHTYFNLNGAGSVLEHQLTVLADRYILLDEESVPTNQEEVVESTPFDFRQGKSIAHALSEHHPQLIIARGLDHYLYNSRKESGLGLFATLYSPKSGICMDIETQERGAQIYTANYLDNICGKGNNKYANQSAVCIETGIKSNTPTSGFNADVIVTPKRPYQSETLFSFYIN